jgi:hypothetical protein
VTIVKVDTYFAKREKTSLNRKRISDRRSFLHRMLGGVCIDCNRRKKEMHMHHVYYPFDYRPNWTSIWKNCDNDQFWNDIFPEVMEACVLLCKRCHKKRHGIK